MTPAPDLARMVPGFEFLQNLMKGASASVPGMLPGMSQWVAPTLDPAEIQKRIDELKTVQFWLEQNARLLSTTIQALEVQRMTLATLQSMNMPMADLHNALRIDPVAATAPSPAAAPSAAAGYFNRPPATPPATSAAAPASEPVTARLADVPTDTPAQAPAATASSVPAVDPMQWWSALTRQFTEIVKDNAAAMASGQAGLPGARSEAPPAAADASASGSRKSSNASGAAAVPVAAKRKTEGGAGTGRRKPG